MAQTVTIIAAVVAVVAAHGHAAVTAAAEEVHRGPAAFEHVHALALDAAARSLWLGAHAGLFRSEDGGRTWSGVNSGLGGHDVHGLAIGTAEGLQRSPDNGGGTWTAVTSGPKNVAAIAVNPKKPGEVYAATMDGTIVRSTDGGAQWAAVRSATDPLRAMDVLRPPAPDVVFTRLDGRAVRVRELRGKPILLGFFTTW